MGASPHAYVRLPRAFFRQATLDLARNLLGTSLVHDSPSGRTAGRIVETEAYLQDDPACHAFRGVTPRTRVMFGEPGYSYVYFIYGMYWCFNVTASRKGVGEAVLVRALEPLEGLDLMRKRRESRGRSVSERELCRGPGKLTIAMGIGPDLNGLPLSRPPLFLAMERRKEGSTCGEIVQGPRIGIRRAAEHPYRFSLKGNPYVSRG